MEIYYGGGKTQYGTGVKIDLTGEDVALAIMAYLVAHDIHKFGPSTITVNGELIEEASIYVDPSGKVIAKEKSYSGRGPQDKD